MDMVRNGKGYPEHCSLSEATALLLEAFEGRRLGSETLAPDAALGRILARDVVSRRNVPHYTASAVDGYALAARTTAGATPATPLRLEPGAHTWVNTGMPVMEQGRDAVAMVEDTSLAGTDVLLSRSLTQGENVRAVGEDVMCGQVVAHAGDRMTPALVSLCLCAGVREVAVRRLPRTLFLPTGNEIVDAATWLAKESLPAGVVVDSNSLYARTLFSAWGYPLDVHPVLPDEPARIAEAVRRGVAAYDLVLVSAGSAKGKRDHSAEIFDSLGRMLFRYVRMKPGRPVMAAEIEGKPVVCTPGFPMSCAVSLWTMVYPLLLRLSGRDVRTEAVDTISEALLSTETREAQLMLQHSSPPGVAEWLRVKLAEVGEATYCWPLSAGASVLWALAEADGIALLDEHNLEMPKGTKVQIRMTRRPDLSRRLLFQGSDDPAVQSLVSHIRERGMDFAIRAVGSMGGLAAISRGEAHLAAAHLLDPESGEYNTSYVERFAAGRAWTRRLIFYRTQGLIVAEGNPKGIGGVEDLFSGDVVFENRQPGAGTRVLLDYMLRECGRSPAELPGYERVSITHMEAANKVASGVADATLGIKAAADALGLDFIPIAQEPYELVFSEAFRSHAAAPALLDALESPLWKEAVRRMGGYVWPE